MFHAMALFMSSTVARDGESPKEWGRRRYPILSEVMVKKRLNALSTRRAAARFGCVCEL
jgi:hypothetical protein